MNTDLLNSIGFLVVYTKNIFQSDNFLIIIIIIVHVLTWRAQKMRSSTSLKSHDWSEL